MLLIIMQEGYTFFLSQASYEKINQKQNSGYRNAIFRSSKPVFSPYSGKGRTCTQRGPPRSPTLPCVNTFQGSVFLLVSRQGNSKSEKLKQLLEGAQL